MGIELKEDLVEKTHTHTHRKQRSQKKKFAEKTEEHSPGGFAMLLGKAQGRTGSHAGRSYTAEGGRTSAVWIPYS